MKLRTLSPPIVTAIGAAPMISDPGGRHGEADRDRLQAGERVWRTRTRNPRVILFRSVCA
ncbi:MAG: hypothetical protein IT530_16695 [Burkholderiales bacterium]|nr:hypothetical protein [Burkholderiales bacterium]